MNERAWRRAAASQHAALKELKDTLAKQNLAY